MAKGILDPKTIYVFVTMTVFCIIGIFIKLIFSKNIGSSTQGPATASLWGYGLVAISILTLIFINIGAQKGALGFDDKTNTNIFKGAIPFTLLLGILMWLITLNLTYFEQINEGDVASEYNTYSFLSTIGVILQLGVVISYLFKTISKKNDAESMVPPSFILAILNVIFAGILTIILKFYSTDG